MYLLISCFFFFFFQAEDGIRDWSVTGVQTCALPISSRFGLHKGWNRGNHRRKFLRQTGRYVAGARVEAGEMLRSEERRVGKECRSEWWGYRYKKRKKTYEE